mmetsp:Transcript_9568/g.22710  ORF Transcript_9568/g.22710 Transcript_9568/m.22710 type:complete len:170 (+) Transcript_9568:266-775(+)
MLRSPRCSSSMQRLFGVHGVCQPQRLDLLRLYLRRWDTVIRQTCRCCVYGLHRWMQIIVFNMENEMRYRLWAMEFRPVRLQCIARHHRRDRWRVQVKLQSMSFCVDHFASTRRLRPVWSDICRMAFPASSSVFICNAVSFGWGSRLKRFLTGTLPHTRLPSEANTRDDL